MKTINIILIIITFLAGTGAGITYSSMSNFNKEIKCTNAQEVIDLATRSVNLVLKIDSLNKATDSSLAKLDAALTNGSHDNLISYHRNRAKESMKASSDSTKVLYEVVQKVRTYSKDYKL